MFEKTLDFVENKKKYEYLDFDQSFRKKRFLWKCLKISILVKMYENLDFGQNRQKNSILVKKKLKISISVIFFFFFLNLEFRQNFRKISNLVKILESNDVVQNWWKISILVWIFEKQ